MSEAKDIIDEISHRMPDKQNLYPALNRAIVLVSKRLKFHDSSLIRGALSVTVSADTSTGSMPSDYWGLLDKPYVSGKTEFLYPLPNDRTKLLHTTDSVPRWYEMVGTTINLIPGTTSEITILGPYWVKPTKITKPTDTMPYNEQFDDVIQEALLNIYITGGVDGNSIGTMKSLINDSIDLIMPGLEQKIPQRTPDAQNLNSYMDGDYGGYYY